MTRVSADAYKGNVPSINFGTIKLFLNVTHMVLGSVPLRAKSYVFELYYEP